MTNIFDSGERVSSPVEWELFGNEEIANLFGDEVHASMERIIDVLKPDRQRLVMKEPWA